MWVEGSVKKHFQRNNRPESWQSNKFYYTLIQGSTNCSIPPSWMGEHGEEVGRTRRTWKRWKTSTTWHNMTKHFICLWFKTPNLWYKTLYLWPKTLLLSTRWLKTFFLSTRWLKTLRFTTATVKKLLYTCKENMIPGHLKIGEYQAIFGALHSSLLSEPIVLRKWS